jgi:hypothetical protein
MDRIQTMTIGEGINPGVILTRGLLTLESIRTETTTSEG